MIGLNQSLKVTTENGDFNAYSTLWGGKKTDVKGEVIEKIMEDMNSVCINDGSGTRIDVHTGNMSALDLTLVSNEMAGVCECEVQKDTIGSDHCPIFIEVHGTKGLVSEEREGRWVFKKAKWDKFKYMCEKWHLKIEMNNSIEEIE